MKYTHKPFLSPAEQDLLNHVTVRLIRPEERAAFDELLVKEHYLHRAELVGEQLRYVAEHADRWVGLLTWNAAAFNLRDREAWIGWSRAQKKRRLTLVVNNSRFVILPQARVPNLASRVLKLCLQRLSQDWLQTYGHEVLVAESFVDSQLFRGTSYKASGWTLLGLTRGYGRHRQDYYVEHERPKQLWVRELRPGARTILRGRNLPAALKAREAGEVAACAQAPEELGRMFQFFAGLPDWRRRDGDYSVASLVTVVVCAALCGVHRGQRDLAAFAADLTAAQMRAVGFPRRGNPRRYLVPKETTFFRLLSHLQSRALEQALLDWQDHVLGPRAAEDDQVSVDGKELLSSQGVAIVSAYAVKSGRWLGSERIAEGSNEIPAAQELLRRAPIEGMLVTADALHTQTETARLVVQERGADYLMTVKGNQPGVADTVRALYEHSLRTFFTEHKDDLVQRYEINRGRPEARCLIRFDATAEQACFPGVEQAARLTRLIDRKEKTNRPPARPAEIETEWLISSRPVRDLSAEQMLAADRRYWGIENGLHLRLDVSAGEDRSRVRTPTSVLNLAMIRRATLSLAIHWIQRCRNKRQATLQGFYDFMSSKNVRKAFSLVTASKPSWSPQ